MRRMIAGGVAVLMLGTASLGSAASATASSTPTSFASSWSLLTPPTSPPVRDAASLAFDPATEQLVLFGGVAVGSLGDTWTWDGTTWTQQAPATSPSPRNDASLAYDAATSQLLLFGGFQSVFGPTFGDTWLWDGTTWVQQSPATSPPPRTEGRMAYDAATSQLVLFGGDGTTALLGDTWTWVGTTWTQQAPATSPPPTNAASMAYDPDTDQLVLVEPAGLAEQTWLWDGTTWTQSTPPSNPTGRGFSSMAFDPLTHQLLLFGGISGSTGLHDTWAWDGATWTQQSSATTPFGGCCSSIAFDGTSRQVILLNGPANNCGCAVNTWLYAALQIAVAPTSGSPGAFIKVTGTGYRPGETVLVHYRTSLKPPPAGLGEPICTATAHPDGTFKCSGHVPSASFAGAPGSHDIVAKGTTSLAKARVAFTLS
jgi:hypothetical protein